MKLRPIQDRVIVKQRDAEEMTEGGIVVAGQQEKPMKGDVIAVGPGRYLESKLIPPTVKVGDVVLFGKNAGEEVKLDDDNTVLVLHEPEILAVLDE